MNAFHRSVLLQEAISYLKVGLGKKYIDATLGGGGNIFEILKNGGKVLGIDVDEEAIEYVESRIQSSQFKIGKDLTLVKGNFRNIGEIARLHGFEKVAGIIFDLGVSSHQLASIDRGFSFQKEGPLDMRMDKSLAVDAADLVNILTKGELYELCHRLGEERYAYAISKAIVLARKIKPITTTYELVDIIQKAVPKIFTSKHQATRVFQALRIAVNDELNNLRVGLSEAIDLLDSGGRLVVISFHSLEDRIVKNKFREFEQKGLGKILTKKPVIPSDSEIQKNIRARSAKLRALEVI